MGRRLCNKLCDNVATLTAVAFDDLQAAGRLECDHGGMENRQHSLLKALVVLQRRNVEPFLSRQFDSNRPPMCLMLIEAREPLGNFFGLRRIFSAKHVLAQPLLYLFFGELDGLFAEIQIPWR